MADREWDFIIVGAGAAGCVLAARLSENPASRVLLIEAGRDFRDSKSSLNFREIVSAGGRHWANLQARPTRTRPPEPCLRGLGTGGSSAIHALTAIRGLPADFDAWEADGCTGWSWNDVLPFFKRLEDDTEFSEKPYHGNEGPIPVVRTRPENWGHVARAFVEAATDLGYPWCPDINAPDASGVYAAPLTLRNGKRISASGAYLDAIRDRENLSILEYSLVERVEFAGSQANGVRIGQTIYRGGTIILAAGAIHSPAILMRSGIGDARELRGLGIRPMTDLPGVGKNLCEHPLIRCALVLRPEARAASTAVIVNDCGMRTTSGGNDLTMFASNVGGSSAEGGIGVSLMQPRSRGCVTLASAAADVDPVIEFDLLSDDRDVAGLQAGVRQATRLLEHRAIRAIIDTASIPGDDPSELLRNVQGFFHAAGTCRMGSPNDPRSVVDSDGRVIGVLGLRVADASIMPALPRAATYFTTSMIAEHLADRIRFTSREILRGRSDPL